jgi:hypothetical protein
LFTVCKKQITARKADQIGHLATHRKFEVSGCFICHEILVTGADGPFISKKVEFPVVEEKFSSYLNERQQFQLWSHVKYAS